MTHGFDLDAAEHDLLRGPVPLGALRWVERVADPIDGAPVALEGGTSSAVHALRAGGRELVLRRFVRADWLRLEPDLADHEAAALRVAAVLPYAVPGLVAHAPDGAGAGGAPAVLMTRVAGAIAVRAPRDLDAYTRALAELLPPIHAVQPPPGALPPYRAYAPETERPPSWLTATEWEQAVAALADPPRGRPTGLVHRDFHPGNVLLRDGRVSGVVDWVNAAVGPAGADVGHCRFDLTDRFGARAADAFTAHHRTLTGHEHHPWDDVAAALGGFPIDALEARDDEGRAFVRRALALLR